jgi:hypothetical protein
MDDTEMKFAVIMERADGDLHEHLRPGTSPCVQWSGCLVGVVYHIHALGIRHRPSLKCNCRLAVCAIEWRGQGCGSLRTDVRRSPGWARSNQVTRATDVRADLATPKTLSRSALFIAILPSKEEELFVNIAADDHDLVMF